MPGFAIVVAADEAGGIGRGGALPWQLPGDMAYFRRLTTTADGGRRNVVIMGRRTWESVPARFRPLPGRTNVVITRNPSLALPEGVVRAASLDAALAHAAARPDAARVFVIGGGEIFREAMTAPGLEAIYLTRIHATFPCDTFLPPLPAGFTTTSRSSPQVESGLSYTFELLEPENLRT